MTITLNKLKKYNGKICTIQMVKVLKFKKGNEKLENRLLKFTTVKNIKVGVSNENASNNQLVRENENPDYKPESPKGKTWILYPIMMTDTKTHTKKYAKFENWLDLTTTEKHFEFNGKVIDSIEKYHDVLLASEWKKYPSKSKPTERQKMYLAPLVESIVYIKVGGEKIYQ